MPRPEEARTTPGADAAPSEEPASVQTLTFLFTDIEGSTGHWRRTPDAMRAALRRHDDLLNRACAAHRGHVFKTVGDAFCVAFPGVTDALACALAAQSALRAEFESADAPLPLRVRMALHSGEAESEGGDYFGAALSRVSRILGLAHGGQILLSAEAAALARHALPEGASLRDLGRYTLKGFDAPEAVAQVLHPALPAGHPPPATPAADTPHNLPRQLTAFVGRERETAEVRRRLMTDPLVTLTGAGGCGKTRLALHVAETLLPDFPDGVWFVDLAPRTNGPQVAEAVAGALSLRPAPGEDVGRQVAAYLTPRQSLLVFDNCEHLLDAAADLADLLLRAAPGLRVLATSREPLEVEGECVWPIPTLALPSAARSLGPKRLAQYEAVQLFVERASALSPRFRLTSENAPHVAAICRRLDGIPLALIVVAAWANVLTPQQIVSRMEDGTRLLRAESHRRAPNRQQTLRNAMDWSFTLLSPAEQALFRRLAVFSGGWDLEAAEAVCAADPVGDASETLFSLVRKSLVITEDRAGGAVRYRLLEPVRQYARERLSEQDGEAADAAARHRSHYAALAAEVAPRLQGADARPWFDRLEAEHDNLRAALAGAPPAEAIPLFADLFWFWHVRGHAGEGSRWASSLMPAGMAEPPGVEPARFAKALNGAGILAWGGGDIAAARGYLARSLDLYRGIGAADAAAGCLSNLGSLANLEGDTEASVGFLQESLALYRAAGNTLRVASVLGNLGASACVLEDWAAATAYLSEAQELLRSHEQPVSLANALYNLSYVARRQGRADVARARLDESYDIRLSLDYKPGLADCLDEYFLLAEPDGDDARAARLFGVAEEFRRRFGIARTQPSSEREVEAAAASLLRRLGQTRFHQEEAAGRTLNPEQVALLVGRAAGT